jgi:hypothetical protein
MIIYLRGGYMKKIFVGTLVLLCLLTVACKKKGESEVDKTPEPAIVGGWETVLANQANDIDEETVNLFNNAKAKYTGLNLDLVALLGKQVVAGTNYMFLVKAYKPGEDDKVSYKIVIVYHDLEGNDTISKVNDFDYTKYTNVNIDANNEQLSGGWNVESSGRPYTLFEDGEDNFYTKATETLTGMNFKPLALIGKQLVAGTNYAVLCYGAATVPDAKEAIYLLTIYEDLNGSSKISSIAYIDLAEFNK